MIVVLAVLRAGLRVEQVVPGDEFEDLIVRSLPKKEKEKTYHAGHTPDIRTRAPLGAQNDLWRAVLACLDVVGEVVADPTRISQVRDLHGYDLKLEVVIRVLGSPI